MHYFPLFILVSNASGRWYRPAMEHDHKIQLSSLVDDANLLTHQVTIVGLILQCYHLKSVENTIF